jgi:hypothetical protein
MVQVKVEVPTDGNKHLPMAEWTATEQKRHDEHLRAFAKWEVDYAAGTVRATSCSGTTINDSGICDACTEVEKDEALKRAVRKVRSSYVRVQFVCVDV